MSNSKINIGRFFETVLRAKLANVRWAWGASDASRNRCFLRVWEDHLETKGNISRVAVLKSEWDTASLGLSERRLHIQAIREGAEGFGVLCTAQKPQDVSHRSIKKYDDRILLRFGLLEECEEGIYAHIVERVPIEELGRHQTTFDTVIRDLKAILIGHDAETMRDALASARIGQGEFRTSVLAMWGARCCVTGTATLEAIRASHIKPWRVASNRERLDPNNGLPLVATLDALFDAGLLAFESDGAMVVSSRIDGVECDVLGLRDARLIQAPNEVTAAYLAFHKESVFVDG